MTFLPDHVTEAINTPAGTAADALLTAFAATEPRRGQGLAEAYRVRMERLLQDQTEDGKHARVIIASRLHLLFQVDPPWAERRLVPLLDWGSNREAAGIWQGFLWAPSMERSLWLLVKPSFLQTFDHLEELDQWKDAFARLFASVAIDGEATLKPEETVSSLRSLGDAGRAQVAFWIQQRLEAAKEEAGDMWRGRVGPWLQRAWPPAPDLKGPEATERLVWAITKSGDAIGAAAEAVRRLAVPIDHPELIFHVLEREQLIERAPGELLRLVDALLPEEPGWVYGLKQFVEKVRGLGGGELAPKEFARLNEIALKFSA